MNNKENLLEKITLFEQELTKIKHAIEKNDEKVLKELFIQSSVRREML